MCAPRGRRGLLFRPAVRPPLCRCRCSRRSPRRAFRAGQGPGATTRERADGLAELLSASMARRPVLCDLLSAQGAVLEQNISAEAGIRHKRAARASLRGLVRLVLRHLPELCPEGAAAPVETTLLTAMAAWQCSRPSEEMPAVYASDPELAAMRLDFTDLVRRTTAVSASGLPARQGRGTGAATPPE
ncbi:hypothetical protein [Streptomyces albidoflavus]|uniref:hypothetical protein n=1 Tax=Streptomyces albidoflavus TaxID=1886 RepID=UPI0033A921A6